MSRHKTRVGLLVTTQDRYELAYVALTTAIQGIDTAAVELSLLWLDGSVHPNSLAFFEAYKPPGIALRKVGAMRGMGAARAIQHGMNLLTRSGEFDWVGMFESDCYFFPDWLRSTLDAASDAENDGLNVGAATPLTNRNRLLYQRPGYGVTEVLPACCTLFRPRAWAHVPPASIGHGFSTRRLHELWTIPRVHPSPALGWDWIFAVALFHGGGFESVTTPATRMLNSAVPEHYKTIPPGSSYADEFLASNVAGHPVPRVRDQEAWQRVVEVLKADSDCGLAAPHSLSELAHFSLTFENGWHPRESDAVRWWRWSDGPSAITVSNDSDVSMKIRLAGEIMLPHRNQTVTISNDAATLAVCRAGSHLFDIELQLPPGHLSVRFTPSLPSRWMRRDSHNLAFGVAVRAL